MAHMGFPEEAWSRFQSLASPARGLGFRVQGLGFRV